VASQVQKDTDLTKDWQSAINRLEGAYAPNTLRSYRSDFSAFAKWCETLDTSPIPATAAMVAAFLDDHADVAHPSTLRRRIAGIRKVHKLMRYPDPTYDEDVRIALRRAKRARPCRPAQALGLTRKRRDALMAACGDDMIGLRNRALVAVGYDTLCRRSELVALRVEDLEPRPRGGFSVLVRRSKNDPFALGRTAWISARTAEILRHWLLAAGIVQGAMFRPVYHGVVIDRFLHAYSVNCILKRLAQTAGLPGEDAGQISGHSMRIGAAQDLMTDGRDILTIMRAGGWTSMNVVSRYVEKADLRLWD
jgi:site-specific recombinase XerD